MDERSPSVKYTCARIALILALLTQITVTQNSAETNLKTIHLWPSHKNAPVEVVKVMKGTTEIQPDVAFEAGDDWLKEISVSLRNVSPSKIVFVSVDAHLPETGEGTQKNPTVAAGNSVGQEPEQAMYSALTGQRRHEAAGEPINLEPGSELVIPIIGERDYEGIKSLIEAKHAVSGVRKCEIWVTTVYFADGTKWAAGIYWRPDERQTGKYLRMRFEDWSEMQHAR
jgi:hypothetical protein